MRLSAASGVPIEGERGVGYVLREPIFLPPMTLTLEELQALHLGAELVRQPWVGNSRPRPNGCLGLLRRAVAARRVLPASYRRLDGTRTVRRIRPLQTECWGRIWTCPAWCELRGVFRVNRIESCQETGDTFALVSGRSYGDYLTTHGARPEPMLISRGPAGGSTGRPLAPQRPQA